MNQSTHIYLGKPAHVIQMNSISEKAKQTMKH